jgi:DNA-binding transcriptional LysR family regulator
VHKLADLRAGDVMIFLSVARCESVSGAARELNLSAPQVSKAVARLEEQLGTLLMVRSTTGITISDDGTRLLPQLTELVHRVQELDRKETIDSPIVVAAPSYMIGWSAPRIAEALPGTRVRAMQLAPALIRTLAARNLFDVCITLAEETLPESWASTPVGQMRRSCFGPPALVESLGAPPLSVDAIRAVPFVLPVLSANGVYIPVDDGCPLSVGQRTAGHEAPTMTIALDIASVTGQLVFGPLMAAHRHLEDGRMVELAIEGWNLLDQVVVSCNVDRVRAPQQRQICDVVRAQLAQLGASPRGAIA